MSVVENYLLKFQRKDIKDKFGLKYGDHIIPYSHIRIISAEVYQQSRIHHQVFSFKCSIKDDKFIEGFDVEMGEEQALKFLTCLLPQNMPPALVSHVEQHFAINLYSDDAWTIKSDENIDLDNLTFSMNIDHKGTW